VVAHYKKQADETKPVEEASTPDTDTTIIEALESITNEDYNHALSLIDKEMRLIQEMLEPIFTKEIHSLSYKTIKKLQKATKRPWRWIQIQSMPQRRVDS
jgi:ATP-dependent Zn protease